MPAASLFWDASEKPHADYAREFPSTQPASAAIRRIRAILEPHWKVQRFNEHPLSHTLMVAPRPDELAHLAQKLELLGQFPGSERVIPRLGSVHDFSAAWYESDFALKLHLAGWKCEFVQHSGSPQPDLVAGVGEQIFEVEITSLNPPREDQLSNTLASMIFESSFRTKCAIGGVAYISNRLSNPTLLRLRTRLLDAGNRARTAATCVWVNEPGLLNLQVAAKEAVHLMDSRWRGTLRFERPTPLPKERRLDSVVRDKVERQPSGARPAVLAVYDRFLTDEEEGRLAKHDLAVHVGTYSALKAVCLIRPLMWTDPFEPKLEEDEMRIYGRHSLPDREGESFFIWRNMMEPASAAAVVHCITEFPLNLKRLFSTGRRGLP